MQNEEAIQRAVAAEGALDVFITSKLSPYEVHRNVAACYLDLCPEACTKNTTSCTFSSSVCFVLPLAYDCLQQGTTKATLACEKILERLKADCVVSSAACHTKYMLTAAK